METSPTIWIVEDDPSISWVLQKALGKHDYQIKVYDCADEAWPALEGEQPDLIISDVRMPGMDGFEFLEKVHARFPRLPVIISTAFSDMESAVSAFQGGAFEYLPKPFDLQEMLDLVDRALKKASSASVAQIKNDAPGEFDIIGEAPSMQEVFRIIGRLSTTTVSVLINGETGTGKELIARALHDNSPRKDKSFVAINAAAIAKDLLESELFGHEKGAFTGAHDKRIGRFEQANGGTLFLDEIGDMPLDLQTRLLRVLSYGEFHRVGGTQLMKTDVRIVAATHQNLEDLVARGDFREDLFHRLNVIRIQIPPLRERKEDIPKLMVHHLEKSALDQGMVPKKLSKKALQFLTRYEWPGNVRQLANVALWLTIMAPNERVELGDLPPDILGKKTHSTSQTNEPWSDVLRDWVNEALEKGEENIYYKAERMLEQSVIEEVMAHTQDHKQETARLMGWGRNTLTRKMKELGMNEK